MMNKIIFRMCPNQSALLFRKIGKLEKLLYSRISKQSYAKQSTVPDKDVFPVENIRNFSIIAHVDHGKSTLADRLLEMTGAIKQNSGKQVLDKLQVEKERGITVKAQTASLFYTYKETKYLLNLIDTPGHVDFSAEVRHSLAPCQGVILVVDANDGVQAQTMANYQLAMQKGLFIIPVINKIDLKNAKPDVVTKQMETLLKVKCTDILKISAKLGTGVEQVLAAVVERIPPPVANRDGKFRALTFDTWVDKYKGPISLVYVKDGSLAVGQHITSMYSKKSYEVKALSMLRPEEESVPQLYAGQIGCIVCNMKNTKDSFLGDTLHIKSETVEPLASFEPLKPMVFSGIYPIEQTQFQNLQNAIEKLAVNDRAVTVSFESSVALGRGFRIGFLGLLHMEVFTQRLEQEFGADPIITAPSATYKAKIVGAKRIKQYGSDTITFNNPADFPDRQITKEFLEPIVLGTIITPHQYKWEIASLCKERRGEEYNTTDIDEHRIMLQFILPLNEIMFDFHDVLKHITSGYASFDYEDQGFVTSDLVKVCILLNSRPIDEFSVISHRTKAVHMGRKLCEKLKDAIPRQLFLIVIQASIDGKITSRQEIKPYKKDVTAKLYGGDVTRRMKLLKQQADGKKKMRMVGNISIPRETFIDVLRK